MSTLFVSFILVITSSICKGQQGNKCDVVPKDQYIEMGSSTEIVCLTSCVNGKIFWTLNNRRVDESLSNTINSTHTILTLSNITLRSVTLQCHRADNQQVLGGATFRTYSKPRNITCVLDYENQEDDGLPQLLTCSWEHPINPSQKINYSVLLTSFSHTTPTEICNSRVPKCTAKNISGQIFMGKNFTVTVRARTAAGQAGFDSRGFNPYHILKIIRPKLEVTSFPDHLLAEWKRSLLTKKCRCQVKYAKVSSADEESLERVLNKTLNPMERGNLIIEKVESCIEYRVSVRCALDMAPWSDWSKEKPVPTKLNKSHVKLRLWRKVAELENTGVRKVRAMWTATPSACQHMFSYTIQQTPYDNHMTSCGNSMCDVDVNRDAHRINLTVFHNETLLAEDSVYVPAIGESLPQVTDIQTSTHEDVILVSWTAPVQPVSGYVIDWTHDGNQYYWKESKNTSATLFDLLDEKPYNITVTPLFDGRTGHGTQALQICSSRGEPGSVVNLSVQPYDKSAYVSWDTESQGACSGGVINYTVFYGTRTGPLLYVTVESKKQDVLLKDLKPDTHYSVYVKATALTGITTSSERLFQTKRFDPRLITTLSVCGSLIIVLVLSLGLCCAVQWKKFREKPVPNPGLSSVALWPSLSHQKRVCPFQPFSNPSASLCDRVYTEETQTVSNPTGDQIEDSTIDLALDTPDEGPVQPVETQNPPSPGESTAFLPSESSPVSPYRSQSSVGTPVSRKQCKHSPVKQQEKTTLKTVYVTLDMFAQGQSR